jgi:hypothetical protein
MNKPTVEVLVEFRLWLLSLYAKYSKSVKYGFLSVLSGVSRLSSPSPLARWQATVVKKTVAPLPTSRAGLGVSGG